MSRMITVKPYTPRVDVHKTLFYGNVAHIQAKYGFNTYGGNANTGTDYHGRVNRKENTITLFHMQKYRYKTARTPNLKYKKETNGRAYISKIVHNTHWVVRAYTFDLSRVITAHQLGRTFKVVLK